RLREIPAYVELFRAAYDDIDQPADITYVHAANAIATFEAHAWRADNSPYDRYLRRERGALSWNARVGKWLFNGRAGCSGCHSGKFQTDHKFYAVAVPQIGPGKGDGVSGREDFGRERVTGNPTDRFRFRTPTLRNVALTGPWGHNGAFDSLEAMIRHHLDPVASLRDYDRSQAVLPLRDDLDALDFLVHDDQLAREAIAAACELPPRQLRDWEIRRLVDFLHALTDPDSIDLRRDVPRSVPSGLPLFD
ncbi:MAG: cytochrome-c peroxidase, partial [Gammaproteobacteria bacterium]|nr:cytochrome-c peroxidase [Gammaproteobacteria bacterium]